MVALGGGGERDGGYFRNGTLINENWADLSPNHSVLPGERTVCLIVLESWKGERDRERGRWNKIAIPGNSLLIADAPQGDAREEGYLIENENLTHPHIFASGQGNSTENLP